MVKIYFETTKDGVTSDGKYSELVAIFDDEVTYSICLEALIYMAKGSNMIVTESVEECDLEDLTLGDENI